MGKEKAKKPDKKKEKKRVWTPLDEPTKFVNQLGKVFCPFCSVPVGDLQVTSTQVKLQDVPYATIGDRNGAPMPNLLFKGVCTFPVWGNTPPPCMSVIQLGLWKNYSETYIDNYPALLRKSTIPCLHSKQDISIIHSGQISLLPHVKPKNAVSVKIGRVIRGNPYIPANATDTGLPDSVPLGKTYEVEVKVTGSGTINLSVINGNANNGNATVTPATISSTTKVIVEGTAKTKPGNAGMLRIKAEVNGKTKALSLGFSVCCHPIDYTDTFLRDLNEPDRIGVVVQDGWSSDNGNIADLNDTEISEVVAHDGQIDTPPFPTLHAINAHNSGYLRGDKFTADTHSMPRSYITLGTAGIMEANQLCIYRCNCCAAVDIPMPNSGFKRTHRVFQSSGRWKHRTEKIGAPVTIGTYSTEAGTANVVSPDHDLP